MHIFYFVSLQCNGTTKKRRIVTVDNSKQTCIIYPYCLPTRAEGQSSSYIAIWVLSVPARMMKMICLIKVQKGTLQNHLACISYILDQGNGNSCKAPCCTAFIINQPRNKFLFNKTKTIWSGKAKCFLSSWYSQFKWTHFCLGKMMRMGKLMSGCKILSFCHCGHQNNSMTYKCLALFDAFNS